MHVPANFISCWFVMYPKGKMASLSFLFYFFLTLNIRMVMGGLAASCGPIIADDTELIQLALNLEFLEAEFFLNSALGTGLDSIAPTLAANGPLPVGTRKANLDALTNRIIEEFGYEEVGHLRLALNQWWTHMQAWPHQACKAIITTIGGFPRPLLNLSAQNFADIFDQAVGHKLAPPFDPYLSTTNYLLASYVIPYVGLVGYVGIAPNLVTNASRRLVAGLLGVESGQDAVLRALLYQRANETVFPYNITVGEFTNRISDLRNRLGACGNKDEGLIVPPAFGAENRTQSNILSADANSLSYARTPQEILRIVYGTGSESKPGGFFPSGGNGRIAKGFLAKPQ